MKPCYLKFANETEAASVLSQVGLSWQEDTNTYYSMSSAYHALDIVGHIVIGGKWDTNGVETEAPNTLDGFHINLLIKEVPEELKPYVVYPQAPSRIFAGV